MGKCAVVEANILATLCSVLKSCGEFGIDFEMAVGVRRKLQRLLGLPQLPSLNRVTELSSNLFIVGLANFPPPMKELEQWLEFLVDLYLQQLSHKDRHSLQQLRPSTSQHNVVHYSSDDEPVSYSDQITAHQEDDATPIPISDDGASSQTIQSVADDRNCFNQSTHEETNENQETNGEEASRLLDHTSPLKKCENSTEELLHHDIRSTHCEEDGNRLIEDRTEHEHEHSNTTPIHTEEVTVIHNSLSLITHLEFPKNSKNNE